jgi:acetate kinase
MTTGSPRTVLSLNGGSSTLKFAAYAVGGAEFRRLARGSVERLGSSNGVIRLGVGDEAPGPEEPCDARDLGAVMATVFAALSRLGVEIDAAGHRMVHGGPEHVQPERIDAGLMASLRKATLFAPLHLPGELALIESVSARNPGMPQVACFDTAFHAGMPETARRLALPSSLWNEGVRRYGFHGLSYESIVHALGPQAAGRVVVAHLGNGASAAALHDGEPQDTTMGLTPCGGLVMGTRSGDLDPGVVIYLLRSRALDADALEELLNRESGLLALSETTSDMRALLDARSSDPRAAKAIDAFCYSARKWIGALAAGLGGLDSLVFTGGIGERSASIREEICRGLSHLGIDLDPARNARSEPIITVDGSLTVARVIPTNEELMVARHTARLIFRFRDGAPDGADNTA